MGIIAKIAKNMKTAFREVCLSDMGINYLTINFNV